MDLIVSDVQANYVRFQSRLAWAFFATPTGWSLAPFLPVYFLLPKRSGSALQVRDTLQQDPDTAPDNTVIHSKLLC